ncbi:VOC family protein [Actinopolymorpha pittospori]|uniref:Lactoylglutathione lyase n=1 Tax=Actinopolymorpha pittospori TaxID=648752 RepID=A0A927MXQ6_9ACTN|nr:VOC family protein [Actinopolymorpha pittospori]MBE1606658.1 lactoylglutathione lyase [Actinopolymorpha pittospori]
MFQSGFPILSTPDIARSLGFYRDLLGGEVSFQYPEQGPPGYVGLTIGSMHIGIGLSPDTVPGTSGQRVSLWFYVDDCDEEVKRLRAAGVSVVEEPADQPWGERMARVLDPDGTEVIIATAEK